MLSEVLMSLLLVVLALGFLLPTNHRLKEPLVPEKFQSAMLVMQSQAMLDKEKQWEGKISFNEFGHINHAQTVRKEGKNIVFFLGMGKSEIREGNNDD